MSGANRHRLRLFAGAAALLVSPLLVSCGDNADDLSLADFGNDIVTDTTAAATTTVPDDPECDPDDPTRSLRPIGEGGTTGRGLDSIRAAGKLVAGVDQDTLLFGYRNPQSGQIEGFDIDILEEVSTAIFGEAGHLELQPIRYSDRVQKLVDGDVDIVADTFTINCRRWARINFSTEYYHSTQKILVAKSSEAEGVADLSGQKVCAAAGSTSVDNLRNANPKAEIVEVVDQTDCLTRFQRGAVDAISTDDTILAGLAAQDPNTKILDESFSEEPYGLGIPKGDEDVVRFVNQVLEDIRVDGRWKQIHEKWLARVGLRAPAPPAAAYRD